MSAEDGRAGASDGGSSSEGDLARRLDRLSRELDAGRREQAAAERTPPSGGSGYAAGFRLASEFVAGVLVGAAIGWGLDRFAGTSPWGLIGFLLLGFVAGVLNAIRVANRTTQAAGLKPDGDETVA
jgi:ATP synthase protein I